MAWVIEMHLATLQQHMLAARPKFCVVALQMSQEVQYSEENGIPAADVANIIHEALTAQRPRTRYILGNESSMHMLAKRVLPDWMWDKILLSYLDVKS